MLFNHLFNQIIRNYDGVRSLIQRYIEIINETRIERTHNQRYRNMPNHWISIVEFNPAMHPELHRFLHSGTSNINTSRNRKMLLFFQFLCLHFQQDTRLRRRHFITRPRTISNSKKF